MNPLTLATRDWLALAVLVAVGAVFFTFINMIGGAS